MKTLCAMICVSLFASVACDESHENRTISLGQGVQKVTTLSPGIPVGGCERFIGQLDNGDMRFAVTFGKSQKYVEVFVQQNGMQNIAKNIVSTAIANADGTFTYSHVVQASKYKNGDHIRARFYSYEPGQPGVFTPGPEEGIWPPDFIYGETTCNGEPPPPPPQECHEYITFLPNGDLRFSVTLTGVQKYVEVFVKQNGTQNVATNIVGSQTSNGDGTYTYFLTRPASKYHEGDVILIRFYSYIQGMPGVFTPGPQEQIWSSSFTYTDSLCLSLNFDCLPMPSLSSTATTADCYAAITEQFKVWGASSPCEQNTVAFDRLFQRMIARCDGSDVTCAEAESIGQANSDFNRLARMLIAQTLTPAEYLVRVRDRSRKLDNEDWVCGVADSDGDMIQDPNDNCPGTPDLAPTDDHGCTDSTLPEAPSANDVHAILDKMHVMSEPTCIGAPSPQVPGVREAYYFPNHPENGARIDLQRITNQPAGCTTFYEVSIIANTEPRAYYTLAFTPDEAVDPDADVLQFIVLPGQEGDRGRLGEYAAFLAAAPVDSSLSRGFKKARVVNGVGRAGAWGIFRSIQTLDEAAPPGSGQ